MKYLIVLLLFSTVFVGCKKQKSINVDPDLKKAFFYKEGTYWVYTDSLSSDVDSFFVTASYDTHDNNDPNGYGEELITILISEYTLSKSGKDTSAWSMSVYGNLINYRWRRDLSTANPGTYISYTNIPYPFATGSLLQSLSIYGMVESVGINYSINNYLFSSVAMLNYYDRDSSYAVFNDVLYLNLSNGLIKMRLFHPNDNINRVWELTRWNIIK